MEKLKLLIKFVSIITLLFLQVGCMHKVEVIPLEGAIQIEDEDITLLPPERIRIYRSTKDPGYEYHEISMLALSGQFLNLEGVAEIFRQEASSRGGDAVIDFNLKSTRIRKWVPADEEDEDGEWKDIAVFSAKGTVIRKLGACR